MSALADRLNAAHAEWLAHQEVLRAERAALAVARAAAEPGAAVATEADATTT